MVIFNKVLLKVEHRLFSTNLILTKKHRSNYNSSYKMSETKDEVAVPLDTKINYKHAADYWANVDPTVDGMLGGFGKVSQIDIEGSNKLIKALFKVLSVQKQSMCEFIRKYAYLDNAYFSLRVSLCMCITKKKLCDITQQVHTMSE